MSLANMDHYLIPMPDTLERLLSVIHEILSIWDVIVDTHKDAISNSDIDIGMNSSALFAIQSSISDIDNIASRLVSDNTVLYDNYLSNAIYNVVFSCENGKRWRAEASTPFMCYNNSMIFRLLSMKDTIKKGITEYNTSTDMYITEVNAYISILFKNTMLIAHLNESLTNISSRFEHVQMNISLDKLQNSIKRLRGEYSDVIDESSSIGQIPSIDTISVVGCRDCRLAAERNIQNIYDNHSKRTKFKKIIKRFFRLDD